MVSSFLITVSVLITVCVLLVVRSSAHPTWGIVADQQGQVYFSDLKTIWKIDARGQLSIFRAGDSKHTHSLNLDEAGNLYGEDDFSAIWKMTSAGGFSYVVAPAKDPPRGIGLLIDRDGNMYAVEHNNHLKRETLLLKRIPGGNVSVLAGSRYGYADGKGIRARFSNIVGVTFGPDGSLYLTDSSNVRRVQMDGTVTTLARNILLEDSSAQSATGSSLFGIAVDAHGTSFVADTGNRRIFKLAPDGQITTVLRSEALWYPTGVAERNGELFILEESHTPDFKPLGVRVRKLSRDGNTSTLATVGENTKTSVDALLPTTNIETVIATTAPSLSWLIGVPPSVFAIGLVVWRVRKKKADKIRK